MKEKSPERRHYIRVGTLMVLSYNVLGIHKEEKKLASKNISGGGIKLSIKERLKVGALLEVKLGLLKENKTIIFKAKVVWVNPNHDNKEYPYEVGLKFININFAQRTQLSNYVQYLDRNELLKDFVW